MTVVAVGAAKGSPGVTTTVLALAGAWPDHREPVVVEVDPSGGDLVARLAALASDDRPLSERPSTVQLAAASRSGVSSRAFLEHLQRLPGRGEVRALVSPASPFAAKAAVDALETGGLASCLAGLGPFDTLIDVGRIDPGSPTISLARAADIFVLVVRPTLESVLHSRELVTALRPQGCLATALVIGSRPYSASEAAAVVGTERFLGELPDDPTGASALRGDARSTKVLARSRLARASAELATMLATDGSAAGPLDRRAVVTGLWAESNARPVR